MRDMQNPIQPVAVPFWATLLGAIFTVFWWASSAGALPAPTSQQIITHYTAVAAPTINALADASRPIAVGGAADESGDLTLQVHTDSVDAPMDAYLAVLAPRIAPNAILLVNASGGLELFTGALTPWKSNVTILDETLFGTIPLELLPGGDYFFYLLLAPAGATNPLNGNFYLWSSVLTLTPTVPQPAQFAYEFSGIQHADISLGGFRVEVFNHSSGQTATELGGGGFPGDGTIRYLVNDFSRTQGQRPTVTNFSLTLNPLGDEITVASVVQTVWDSADKKYMISRKTMELTNIPLVYAESDGFWYHVGGESVCGHISSYSQETFNSDGTPLTESVSGSCSVASSLSITLTP